MSKGIKWRVKAIRTAEKLLRVCNVINIVLMAVAILLYTLGGAP
jgi:hypothetical protein